MRRRTSLTATFTALFALQVPLCALACLGHPEDAAAAQHAEQPCHEADPASPPQEAPSSHEDCGCGPSEAALASGQGEALSTPVQAFALQAAPRYAATSRPSWMSPIPRDTDLPPPDILLLKSTLLL